MRISMWQDMFNKGLETLNERIDGFSRILLQSSRPPEPVPVPDKPKIVPIPSLKHSTAENVENDIVPIETSDKSLSYLERYFEQGFGKTDEAVQWMNERYNKVKEYYKPFENNQSVNVAVFMGLILPEAKTGFREGLYNGGFLGEMIQWMDILTALNSFQKIVMGSE